LTEITALFSGSPRFTVNRQPEAGHNISLGHTAADYHSKVFAFADECVTAAASSSVKLASHSADADTEEAG